MSKEQVIHPEHYNTEGRKECWDEMLELFGTRSVAIFDLLSAYKYYYRAGQKEGNSKEQDIAKMENYINHVRLLDFSGRVESVDLSKIYKIMEQKLNELKQKERPLTIAVDFDGTLCENRWPEIGEPNDFLIDILKKWREKGNKVILWTCRTDKILHDAVEWCRVRGLIFDAVNENLPETIKIMGGDSRKIWADTYIDDKNSLINPLTLPFYEIKDTEEVYDASKKIFVK